MGRIIKSDAADMISESVMITDPIESGMLFSVKSEYYKEYPAYEKIKNLNNENDNDTLFSDEDDEDLLTVTEDLNEDADSVSRRIISEAERKAELIKEEARRAGYEEGIAQVRSDLSETLCLVRKCITDLQTNQEEFFDECSDQLKFLAIEIAEKIMAQKIETDPAFIIPLVKSAVKSIREVSWIKVEISDRINQISGELEKSLNELKPDTAIEVESRRGSSPGTCVVHTADGVTVASVQTQIENIYKYFSEYRENNYDERESGSDKTQKESQSK